MAWIDDQHVGCPVGYADDHGWCEKTRKLTCTWCGHPACARPRPEEGRDLWLQDTVNVLQEVLEERSRQVERYGLNADLADGTGPTTRWVPKGTGPDGPTAAELERIFRQEYEQYEEENGQPTFMHLVREEVAEAFQEEDPERLAEELVQVAALCVSWVALIRGRD